VSDEQRRDDRLAGRADLPAHDRLATDGLTLTRYYTHASPCVDAAFDDHDHEWYELDDDPHELVNLAHDPGRRAELRANFHRLLEIEAAELGG
jgi:arylsulfatase A-like enzyme